MNETICQNCEETFYYSTTEHRVDCPHCFSSVAVTPNLPFVEAPPEPPFEEAMKEVTENAT